MQAPELIRVLLVEDDEDDYILTRGLFSELRRHRFQLEWFKSYQLGLDAMVRNQHDVCLLDYRLGARNAALICCRKPWRAAARRRSFC